MLLSLLPPIILRLRRSGDDDRQPQILLRLSVASTMWFPLSLGGGDAFSLYPVALFRAWHTTATLSKPEQLKSPAPAQLLASICMALRSFA